MDEYREMIFVCAVIFTGIGAGVLIFHGIGLVIRRIGLMIMPLHDISTGKRRLCVLRRVL